MKRMLLITSLLVLTAALQGCVTGRDAEPSMDKMAAANATNPGPTPKNDYMFRSSTYQTGQTAEPYIGR